MVKKKQIDAVAIFNVTPVSNSFEEGQNQSAQTNFFKEVYLCYDKIIVNFGRDIPEVEWFLGFFDSTLEYALDNHESPLSKIIVKSHFLEDSAVLELHLVNKYREKRRERKQRKED